MNPSRLIFIVEDEAEIATLLKITLEKEKYKVRQFENATNFLSEVSKKKEIPSLVILDLMLPDLDGFEVCKFLKRDDVYQKIPVIMLTAKSEEMDKVLGLEIGADDYITKPFSINELKARIKAVLRRQENVEIQTQSIRMIEGYKVDFNRLEVSKDGEKIELTTTEFKILDLLSKKRGWVYSREQIINYLWGHEKYPTERTIDVHINNLRKKLPDLNEKIVNVRGVGYKLEE
jgi:two-component system phosphate regulon response regulator PhoB/two-component system alkaline phosphatase synthesis response regulator PhoP